VKESVEPKWGRSGAHGEVRTMQEAA